MSMRYVCPCCQVELRMAGSRVRPGPFGATWDIHLECMTCSHILGITVSVPSKKGFFPREEDERTFVKREVESVDSRDDRTTWLWLNDGEFVEVDPVELHANMLENCC